MFLFDTNIKAHLLAMSASELPVFLQVDVE